MYGDPATHWSMKWLGRAFVPEKYDCLDFVQDVLRTDRGKEIRIPPRRRGTTVRIMASGIAQLGGEVAVPRRDAVQEFDAVLMKPCGTRITGYHIGLAALVEGVWHVLHCVEGLGSVLYPASTIHHHGWEIEGYYRWL